MAGLCLKVIYSHMSNAVVGIDVFSVRFYCGACRTPPLN